MWKKIMFGIIIGVVLMTVSTGVIYGAQGNSAPSAANSSNTIAGNGKGNDNCINQNCNGDCDGTGNCINQNSQNNNYGNCDVSNCPNLQNGQQQNSYQNDNSNGLRKENKNAGSGCAASGKNKNYGQYEENNSFRNAFARFQSFFKFGNNS